MATRARSKATAQKVRPLDDSRAARGYVCSMPHIEKAPLPAGLNPDRAALIAENRTRWANGTVLHYYFFDKESDGRYVDLEDGSRVWRGWKVPKPEKKVIRKAFTEWKSLGIGLDFLEVEAPEEAEIRIGCEWDDGSWSYLGRDVLERGPGQRTMNFGWRLTGDIDTALHEIGHTLGFPHAHQNPNAGIVWNEDNVYEDLAGPPNYWMRSTTFDNIIRKLPASSVQGSDWDPDSIMQYPFKAGLIEKPEQYRGGLDPAPGLSDTDIAWVRKFYPPLPAEQPNLAPARSVPVQVSSGDQINFTIRPEATRKYNIRTFGTVDTVMVLFENEGGDLRYLSGDDDSGADRNSGLEVKLFKGRQYVLRVKFYYVEDSPDTAVMLW